MPNIKEIVENPHWIYKRYLNYWNFLLNSYEGGVDYTNAELANSQSNGVVTVKVNGKDWNPSYSVDNLFKHTKETDTSFRRRSRLSYYYNFCQPIIDTYTEHLFRDQVTEDWGAISNVVEKRQQNVDGRNSSIFEFRRNVSDLTQIFGHLFVVADMPKSNGEITLQQRIENNQFPYFSIFNPMKVLNWSLDKFGEPYWVLLQEDSDSNVDVETFDKNQRPSVNYKLWTRNEWFLFNSNYELIESSPHPLKRVPIVCFYDRPSKKVNGYLGISTLSDISFIARNIYNLCSELHQIIEDQTFSFLALQGNVSDYQGDDAIGTTKGLVYPEGSNVPQYIAPPNGPADVIMEQIDRQIKRIYQMAKLEGGSAHQVESVKEQSGVSKAFDFQDTNSSLTRKSSNLNDGELRMWELFAAWENTKFDGVVIYPNEFSIRSVNDDINEALNMGKLAIGNKVKTELNKLIIKKKFPRINEEELNGMIADMEKEVSGSNDVANRLLERIKQQNTANSSGILNGGLNGKS